MISVKLSAFAPEPQVQAQVPGVSPRLAIVAPFQTAVLASGLPDT